MKKFTLLMVALLLSVVGVNAKTKSTTLWENTYEGGNIEISVDKLVSGATITVSTTVTSGNTSDDRKLHIFYTAVDGWAQTSFADISDWVELTAGQESYSFTLTSSAYDILSDDTKSHKILYIGANNKDYVTISKITMIAPTGETELLTEEKTFTTKWEWAEFAAQSGAKIGDVIRLTYKAYENESTEWPYVQFNIKDNSNADIVSESGVNKAKNSINTYDYEISDATVLEKIQTGGFKITGARFILTSVKLLTYEDSYDAVAITVGSDGIATYSNGSKDVQISACGELKAYYASAVAEGTVTLTELTCIPASQGAIVKGTAGTSYTVKVGSDGYEDLSSKNYLKPTGDNSESIAASTEGKYHYIFAKKSSGTPAFYKLVTAAHTLAAHKAYLETATDIAPNASSGGSSGNSRSITIDFGDGTTAIMDVLQDDVKQQLAQEDGVYYTLQGTRVQNPTKGLYILNGKKIIVK